MRDDRFGLTEGAWVEIQDDWSVLQNRPGNLLQVQHIDPTTLKVTLSGSDSGIAKDLEQDPVLHPLLRRWDQQAGDPSKGGLTLESDCAALIMEDGSWLTLEDGVQIQFQPPRDSTKPANQYRTGDYWLIPARTATGDVEWPRVVDAKGNPETDAQGNPIPMALPPEGITHHYAPLAVINADGTTTPCLNPFKPLVQCRSSRPS